MEKNPLGKPSGNGLELDKIEVPVRSPRDTVRGSTSDSEGKSAFPSETGSSAKRRLRLMLTVVITTLVLLAVMAIYLRKQDLTVSFLSVKSTAGLENYLRVGPITATIKNDEILRLSLDIECENDAVKKRLAGRDSHIRDKIVSIITAPDTDLLFEQHRYDAVRAKIKESLEKIYGESIGEVYFAEILTY